MSFRVIPVTMTVYATVVIHDDEPFTRVTGPGGDEWRAQFYDLHDEADIAEHFVLTNGVYDVSALEGWADVPKGAVHVEIDDTYVSAEPRP